MTFLFRVSSILLLLGQSPLLIESRLCIDNHVYDVFHTPVA